MAKNIETYSIKLDMIDDIMRCYREVAPECLYQETAWQRTVCHPAKEFYITAHQAYQRINLYLGGRTEAIDSLKPLAAQRFRDLIKVVMRLAQMPEYQGKTLRALCKIAVKQPAPRFYIGTSAMKALFKNVVNGVFADDGRS